MRALRFRTYGGPEVLAVEDLPEPIPGAGQAKVRVHAVALNALDWKIRAGHVRFVPAFAAPPRGVGSDFAGEIVAVGGGATTRHVGERVFGSLLPFGREGALADHLVAAYDRLLPIPRGLDEAAAATLPIAGGAALQAIVDDAGVAPGQRVLITGAAGGVGHFAVQIARHLGARVTGVCSAANVEFVRGLGADEVIDYGQEDFLQHEARYDVVLDAAGVSNFTAARRILTGRGCYLNLGGDAAALADTLAHGVLARLSSRQRCILVVVRNRRATWERLLQLVAAGALAPHIERSVRLEDVGAVQADMATGHGRGKTVVQMIQSEGRAGDS